MVFSLNFILILIIFVYLLYSFIKTRKKQKLTVSPKETVVEKAATDYEKHVITAVLASVMGDNKYIIKSIYPTGQVNEKKSFWKVSGRQESMNSRLFFRKK